MARADLTRGERFIYDWQHRQLGHFYTLLADLMVHADTCHMNQLENAFPKEVQAYRSYMQVMGWWERVKELHAQPSVRRYAIRHRVNPLLLWSDAYGWVGRAIRPFSVFTKEEMGMRSLPDDGMWIQVLD